MREPGAVVVAFVLHENLGFVFEPTKSGGMNDAVSVSLKSGSVRMLLLLVVTSPTVAAFNSIGSQTGLLEFLDTLPLDQFSITHKYI